MRRLVATVSVAVSLGACLDLGTPEPESTTTVHPGDGGMDVEGGCWQGKSADCDGIVQNGCETPLDTLENCGACGVTCSVPANGSATCSSGSCERSCNSGYANCDNDWSNGCESLSTSTDCGSCGVPCASTCNAGTCCQPDQGACSVDTDCCDTPCHAGQCCRSANSDCTQASQCCVDYCTAGICCKPPLAACNQNGTCCSGSCVNGACT